MRLQLSLLSWPDGAGPDTRTAEREVVIGRGQGSNWILADPVRSLSRLHCVLAPYGEGWRLTDFSANGTFINDAPEPLGREQSCELHDGDRIRLGQYVIEVRYDAPPSLIGRESFNQPGWPGGWAVDPEAGQDPGNGGGFGRRIPEPGSVFPGPPMPDHEPASRGIWQQAVPARPAPPEDFDPAAAKYPSGISPAPQQAPDASPRSAGPSGDDYDPAAPPADGTSRASDGPAPGQGADAPVPAGSNTPADAALLDAFLRGAGIRSAGDAEPLALMETAGATLRAIVEGLRAIHFARGEIRRDFRILATIGAARNGNPIKASASTDAALYGLLNGPYKADTAVAEMLGDIGLHETAMVAAMGVAVAALLGELSPDKARGAEGGAGALLPLQRRARAFEQYEALYKRVADAMKDDFDSVFGKAFARAYEQVVFDKENKPR